MKKMIVIYEIFTNEFDELDERNIGDFDTLREAKYFLENKFDTKTSIANLSKMIQRKGTINKKYKIFKINF